MSCAINSIVVEKQGASLQWKIVHTQLDSVLLNITPLPHYNSETFFMKKQYIKTDHGPVDQAMYVINHKQKHWWQNKKLKLSKKFMHTQPHSIFQNLTPTIGY